MKRRTDIAPPRDRAQYDFDSVKPGESWHVTSSYQRANILTAFKYWATNVKKVPAKATSLKVDATDPDGPGYRIWFVSTRKAAPAKGAGDAPLAAPVTAPPSNDI